MDNTVSHTYHTGQKISSNFTDQKGAKKKAFTFGLDKPFYTNQLPIVQLSMNTRKSYGMLGIRFFVAIVFVFFISFIFLL